LQREQRSIEFALVLPQWHIIFFTKKLRVNLLKMSSDLAEAHYDKRILVTGGAGVSIS
jgi:hypothetical protein